MYILVIGYPLVSALFVLFTGKLLGNKGTILLIILSIFINMLLSIFLLYEVAFSNYVCSIDLYKWLDLGFVSINIGLFFDTITVVIIFVVCFISFLVHIYSIEYMSHDISFIRFMAYLSLFTFFMLFLVASNNFVQMFLGWEGVGLASYLLISFWYTRVLANKAAIKAMLVNKVGDLALLISICLILYVFGTLDYIIIYSLVDYIYDSHIVFITYTLNILNLICLFLFIGAMGKSAQIGLHVWLPEAMEGPTPVSALIHAATMVTAGVFLVIRNSVLFEYCSNILWFIGIIGSITCLFAAIIGCFQFDIKRVVAYSTCSQLGYMFFSSGLSNYNVSLFHLFNHAFFKALLFLSMGAVLHALNDEQDMRKMGALLKLMPFTYVMVMIGSIALLGLPFLTGYYSKDFLLEFTFSMYTMNSIYVYSLGIIAAFFTTFYSLRLIYWIFFSFINVYKLHLSLVTESGIYMTFAMFILSLCSIAIGYIFFEAFIGLGTNFFDNSIYVNYNNMNLLNAEYSIFFIKYIPFIITIISILCFIVYIQYYENIYLFFIKNTECIKFYKIFNKAFYFDIIYGELFFKNFLKFSYTIIYKYVEKGLLNYFLFNFIKLWIIYWYNCFISIYSGLLYDYIFLILVSIVYITFIYFCILFLGLEIIILLYIGIYIFIKKYDKV